MVVSAIFLRSEEEISLAKALVKSQMTLLVESEGECFSIALMISDAVRIPSAFLIVTPSLTELVIFAIVYLIDIINV
jgi:hypothetical protein